MLPNLARLQEKKNTAEVWRSRSSISRTPIPVYLGGTQASVVLKLPGDFKVQAWLKSTALSPSPTTDSTIPVEPLTSGGLWKCTTGENSILRALLQQSKFDYSGSF